MFVRRETNRNRDSRRMELASENHRRTSRLSPQTHFSESPACGASRGNRSHAPARACSYPRAISSRPAADFTARARVAAGLSRFRNRRREALSYVAVSSEASCPTFHLSLPELPARFSSRAQDQALGGMPRLLPRTQRRSIRCPFSSKTAEIIAALCQTPGARAASASTTLYLHPLCFSRRAISPG